MKKHRICVWILTACMALSAAVQMPGITASAQENAGGAGIAVQQESLSTAVLERMIELAKKADTEGVIPIVVSEYETRMANAENLVARVEAGDTSVTQDMIDESWKSLMEILQYLEFKQGDKSSLESAIEFAEGLDMNDYEDNEKKTVFLEALEAAKAVRDDENAMEPEITAAWKALIKASAELNRKMADMTDLKKVIAWMETLDLDKYLEAGKQEFKEALEAAKVTAENIMATQAEVDDAWKALMDAGSALRLKPDKGALDELLQAAEKYLTDETSYEQAAFASFRAVYAEAEAVFMNDQATADEVSTAVEKLTSAAAELENSPAEPEEPVKDDTEDAGQEVTTGGDESTVLGSEETTTTENTASENTDDVKVVAKAEPAQTAEKSDGTTTTVKVPAAAGGTTVTATSKAVKTGDTADFMYLIVLLGASVCIASAAAVKKVSGRR